MELKLLIGQAKNELAQADSLAEISALQKKYLGRKSELTKVLRSLAALPLKKRKTLGRHVNESKKWLENEIAKKQKELRAGRLQTAGEWLDVTAPGKKIQLGHLHPLTQVIRQVEQIFSNMGFEIASGPHIETEYYNFDALNIPAEHPARDLWDTFWLKPESSNVKIPAKIEARQRRQMSNKIQNSKSKNLLLRTHTSPVQIRYMEKHQPPLRIISPGRCFRHEATDASHAANFYQVEGLMVDRSVSAANFRAVLEAFFSQFFGQALKNRLRPSYFPFTEPSFEVDVSCLNCAGKGCSACGFTGWMEMMGAGLVHPQVFKNVGYDAHKWQGFAFGIGLDRLAMLKFKIPDIRLLYSGDLRVLTQF